MIKNLVIQLNTECYQATQRVHIVE